MSITQGCKVSGCKSPGNTYKGKTTYPLGMCAKHYYRMHKYGKLELAKEPEIHGLHSHPLYKTWSGMKQRCYNKNTTFYRHYGGRGIKVCDRWRDSFKSFLEDMGERPSKNYSLDRINNDGDYTPDNCRWATQTYQNLNKGMDSKNSSGYKGVSYHSKTRKWRAYYSKEYKFVSLGLYHSPEEAYQARLAAESDLL